ncbi:hypothetical protein ACW9HQ_45765, partial [Nocardia gipuzkoensis]
MNPFESGAREQRSGEACAARIRGDRHGGDTLDNELYLDRAAIRGLSTLLREIPELTTDLLDSVTRRARLGERDRRWQQRSGAQPLPYNPVAAAAADRLHAT